MNMMNNKTIKLHNPSTPPIEPVTKILSSGNDERIELGLLLLARLTVKYNWIKMMKDGKFKIICIHYRNQLSN